MRTVAQHHVYLKMHLKIENHLWLIYLVDSKSKSRVLIRVLFCVNFVIMAYN